MLSDFLASRMLAIPCLVGLSSSVCHSSAAPQVLPTHPHQSLPRHLQEPILQHAPVVGHELVAVAHLSTLSLEGTSSPHEAHPPGLMWALTGAVGVGAVGGLQHTGSGSTITLCCAWTSITDGMLQGQLRQGTICRSKQLQNGCSDCRSSRFGSGAQASKPMQNPTSGPGRVMRCYPVQYFLHGWPGPAEAPLLTLSPGQTAVWSTATVESGTRHRLAALSAGLICMTTSWHTISRQCP